MIICKGNIDSFDIPKDLILAVGNFDGVHLGHQKVINSCINIGKHSGFIPAVLTFDPHPNSIVNSKNGKRLIYNNNQKLEILKTFPIYYLFIINFNENLMRLSCDEFVEEILIKKFGVKAVVTGHNFHFGYKKLGDVNVLNDASKEHGFSYYSIEECKQNGIEISSSKIRELLSRGMIETTNELLGRKYAICGNVIYGKKLAETLGFKTANILLDEQYIYPLKGVYLVQVIILGEEQKFYGVANIGIRPTVTDKKRLSLEIHIFDFEKDIYKRDIEVEFLHFIRPERNLGSIENLKMQVKKDIKDARYLLSLALT